MSVLEINLKPAIISYTNFAMQNKMSWVTVSVLASLNPILYNWYLLLSVKHAVFRSRAKKSGYDMFVNRLEVQ